MTAILIFTFLCALLYLSGCTGRFDGTKVVLIILSSIPSVVASFVITWLVWEMCIEGQAFDCIDSIPWIPSDGFWTSIDTHESAGDRIRSGWTWDELRLTRSAFQFAFVTLWIAGSVAVFRVARHIFGVSCMSTQRPNCMQRTRRLCFLSGDVLSVKVVEADSADKPRERQRPNAASDLRRHKQYVRRMAKQFRWKIQT